MAPRIRRAITAIMSLIIMADYINSKFKRQNSKLWYFLALLEKYLVLLLTVWLTSLIPTSLINIHNNMLLKKLPIFGQYLHEKKTTWTFGRGVFIFLLGLLLLLNLSVAPLVLAQDESGGETGGNNESAPSDNNEPGGDNDGDQTAESMPGGGNADYNSDSLQGWSEDISFQDASFGVGEEGDFGDLQDLISATIADGDTVGVGGPVEFASGEEFLTDVADNVSRAELEYGLAYTAWSLNPDNPDLERAVNEARGVYEEVRAGFDAMQGLAVGETRSLGEAQDRLSAALTGQNITDGSSEGVKAALDGIPDNMHSGERAAVIGGSGLDPKAAADLAQLDAINRGEGVGTQMGMRQIAYETAAARTGTPTTGDLITQNAIAGTFSTLDTNDVKQTTTFINAAMSTAQTHGADPAAVLAQLQAVGIDTNKYAEQIVNAAVSHGISPDKMYSTPPAVTPTAGVEARQSGPGAAAAPGVAQPAGGQPITIQAPEREIGPQIPEDRAATTEGLSLVTVGTNVAGGTGQFTTASTTINITNSSNQTVATVSQTVGTGSGNRGQGQTQMEIDGQLIDIGNATMSLDLNSINSALSNYNKQNGTNYILPNKPK